MKKKNLPDICKISTKRDDHIVKNMGDKKLVEVFEEVYTRKISRRKAKTIMKSRGLTRICADPKHKGSYFADHWKEAVNYG